MPQWLMTINEVNLSNAGASVALIAALIGGVAGTLLLVFVSTLIPLSFAGFGVDDKEAQAENCCEQSSVPSGSPPGASARGK